MSGSTGASASSKTFEFYFSPCCVPDYCANVTIDALTPGSEPGHFFADYGAQNTSDPFPRFPDALTADCATTCDCSQYQTYSLEVSDCSGCSDEDLCDDSCAGAWTEIATDSAFTYSSSLGTTTFQSPAVARWGKFKAQILATSTYHTNGEAPAVSDAFSYWLDGQPACDQASLLPVDSTNVPAYYDRLYFDYEAPSDTPFEDYGNDICPEYCYDPDRQCDPNVYEILCTEDAAVPPDDPSLLDISLVRTQLASSGDPYYDTVIYSDLTNVFFRSFDCLVSGTTAYGSAAV